MVVRVSRVFRMEALDKTDFTRRRTRNLDSWGKEDEEEEDADKDGCRLGSSVGSTCNCNRRKELRLGSVV